jgi:hypothetical protein
MSETIRPAPKNSGKPFVFIKVDLTYALLLRFDSKGVTASGHLFPIALLLW